MIGQEAKRCPKVPNAWGTGNSYFKIWSQNHKKLCKEQNKKHYQGFPGLENNCGPEWEEHGLHQESEDFNLSISSGAC